MNYKEIYQKAEKDLENVRVQKARLQEKINSLVEQLDLDKTQPLAEQVSKLRDEITAKQKTVSEEIEKLAEALKAYE